MRPGLALCLSTECGRSSFSGHTGRSENVQACTAAHYFTDVDLEKSGFDGEHTESNHRLMYT